jgi:MORN repeat
MHGLGTYTWPDGHIYIGTRYFLIKGLFEHNLKEGYGMMVWPDGTKYRGQYHGGKQTGFGRVSISG